jgi:type IV/VI secretion system ImpK/VasF family protein
MAEDPRWARVQVWRNVREAFAAAEELFEEAGRQREAFEREPASAPGGPPPASYLRKRKAARDALGAKLDAALAEHLDQRQKHLSMVAIAAYVDERERVALGPLAEVWRLPLLQAELLEVDDGGDRFFSQLAELMARPDVHELVFELHLLCLRAGFVGRYRDRRHDLDRLIEHLSARVRASAPRRPPALPGNEAARRAEPKARVSFVGFPMRYYVGALAAVAIGFVALRLLSNHEVATSELASTCSRDEPGAEESARSGGAP